MKSFTLSVMASALIAGAVATDPHVKRQAEILASLPACVQNCLLTAFSEHGTSCSPTDFSCLCSLSDFIMASGKCYLTCDAADQAAGMDFGKKSCASVGITLPDLPGGAAPSAPATPAAPETPAAPAPSAAPAAPVKPTTPEATHPALPETPCVWLPKSMHPTAHNGTGSTSSMMNSTMMNSTMDVTFNVTIVGAHNLGLNTSTWNGLPVCPETCNTTSAPTMPMTPSTPAAPVTPAAPAKNTSYTSVDASSSASKKEITISATVIVALVGFFFF